MKSKTDLSKESLSKVIDTEIVVKGWIENIRLHGKIGFIDLRDGQGYLQVFVGKSLIEILKSLNPETPVEIQGLLQKRPEKMVNDKDLNGDLELQATLIKPLSSAEILPVEKDMDTLQIPTYLDFLPITLRGKKSINIFKFQAEIIRLFREFLVEQKFVEIQVPKIVGDDAEGGASVFEIKYFGHKASLATSPQLYKQIMVGVLERVFTTTSVYRAEKHSTVRHLNEYTSLDLEMGFITDHTDIMNLETKLLRYIIDGLAQNKSLIEDLQLTLPIVSESIPTFKLREAQEILESKGFKCLGESDLEPEHEKILCQYAKEELQSEFVFITHYPVSKRPFYTKEDENDKGFTKSFDLLFRGLEITTGGQRINDYQTLLDNIQKWGLKAESFEYYLQAFKYGMPPEGGLAIGLERLTAQLLNINNVKLATLFPRDINRIDKRLS